MNKHEAAEFLGISLRTLERHTQANRVAARYEEGKTRSVLEYDQSELERFKAELEAPRHRPALERAGGGFRFEPNSATNTAVFGDIPPEALMGALVHLMQFAVRNTPALEAVSEGSSSSSSGSGRNVAVPTADKTLLSIEEAGAITGLSRTFLKTAITQTRLPARKIGRAWRIKRRDLDHFVDNL